MAKSIGQSDRTEGGWARPASRDTRQRLMQAAAELIAELGWGRVTTRAVAERAGLPHGSVSYHFRSKQELLVDAALHTFEQQAPMTEFETLENVDDLIEVIKAQVGAEGANDYKLTALMMETMREAERDSTLRQQLTTMLAAYRSVMADIIERDPTLSLQATAISREGLATALAAIGDGLILHAVIDPELDMASALEAVRALVRASQSPPHSKPARRRSAQGPS